MSNAQGRRNRVLSVTSLTDESIPVVSILKHTPDACYLGEHIDESRQGIGLCKYTNGDLYQGYWQQDRRHGLGTYSFTATKNR